MGFRDPGPEKDRSHALDLMKQFISSMKQVANQLPLGLQQKEMKPCHNHIVDGKIYATPCEKYAGLARPGISRKYIYIYIYIYEISFLYSLSVILGMLPYMGFGEVYYRAEDWWEAK